MKDYKKDFELLQFMDEKGNLVKKLPKNINDELLIEMLGRMVFMRTLDERSIALNRQGRLGFYAPFAGQEASAVGSQLALDKNVDWIAPGYRDIPQLYYHGLSLSHLYSYSKGMPYGGQIPENVNVLMPQVIIGAQITQATGIGLGMQLNQEKGCVVTYTGDGGASQGDFYEGMNFAGVYNSPVIFIVQNNHFAISTPSHMQTKAETIAQKSVGVGIQGVRVDGMDIIAVYQATKEARERALNGEGPTLLELVNFRYGPHTMAGDDPKRYRVSELEEEWIKKDPIVRLKNYLVDKNLWSQELEDSIKEDAKKEVASAVSFTEKIGKSKVSDLISYMYEEMPSNLKEQHEFYLGKESK